MELARQQVILMALGTKAFMKSVEISSPLGVDVSCGPDTEFHRDL